MSAKLFNLKMVVLHGLTRQPLVVSVKRTNLCRAVQAPTEQGGGCDGLGVRGGER